MRAVSCQPICQLRMVLLISSYTRLSMFLKTWLYNIEHVPENYLSHGGSILGVKFLDPLVGLVVSGIILKDGLEKGYQSVLELVDAAILAENLMPIQETILKVKGVKGCHRLRGRRAGSPLYLDVHIVLAGCFVSFNFRLECYRKMILLLEFLQEVLLEILLLEYLH
ncbi:metal tolerance protein C1-like isoform X2 [Citrus sinensis]|uniref:metal tolerance protein C1-like isoform X2 n=1 Tax=Citrus sinensis TaxID=2711 RepID=UPI002278CFD2|nr:metal tolerance protein C1-like isoform X2 [Citrus sinensis]